MGKICPLRGRRLNEDERAALEEASIWVASKAGGSSLKNLCSEFGLWQKEIRSSCNMDAHKSGLVPFCALRNGDTLIANFEQAHLFLFPEDKFPMILSDRRTIIWIDETYLTKGLQPAIVYGQKGFVGGAYNADTDYSFIARADISKFDRANPARVALDVTIGHSWCRNGAPLTLMWLPLRLDTTAWNMARIVGHIFQVGFESVCSPWGPFTGQSSNSSRRERIEEMPKRASSLFQKSRSTHRIRAPWLVSGDRILSRRTCQRWV